MANVPSPLPGPMAGIETNVSVNMLSRMPGIHGKNSLHFRGKNILEFLMEYEHAAKHANLTNKKKCQELRIYFMKKEKCILDVLEGYINENWQELRKELMSLYTSSEEKKTYRPKDMQQFSTMKRKITRLLHFDNYQRKFKVIMVDLEKHRALSEYDCNNYFWSGIQPTSL